jgi:hypothetical protein
MGQRFRLVVVCAFEVCKWEAKTTSNILVRGVSAPFHGRLEGGRCMFLLDTGGLLRLCCAGARPRTPHRTHGSTAPSWAFALMKCVTTCFYVKVFYGEMRKRLALVSPSEK